MNQYRHRFNVRCPNQEHGFIGYILTIESADMIMVEDIKKHCKFTEAGYHEDIADYLFEQLGGSQTITAVHHDVEITTLRENNERTKDAIKKAVLSAGLGNWDKVVKIFEREMK